MKQLNAYIQDPQSAECNFWLAVEYYEMGHFAGAISHFLRAAEYGDRSLERELIYESLIHLGLCFQRLGRRSYTESGWFLQAMAYNPNRMEAYWLMSLFYEFRQQWQEAYTMASIGFESNYLIPLHPIGFEGEYMLLFQKAVSAYWLGRTGEARDIFFSLPEYPLNQAYIGHVQRNLSRLGSRVDPFLPYSSEKAAGLRFKFDGYERVMRNFSQIYQDMFVLSMLNGKRNGYYLEIGSADPFLGSNTCLLEQEFDWRGISIEILESEVEKFKQHRKNPVVCRDASTINYDRFLGGLGAPEIIDYLQLDCEPPQTTYDILLSIPLERYRFRVITFEHDFYADASRKIREKSRIYLRENGYELIVNDIAPDHKSTFEDWWVDPELVDPKIVALMKSIKDGIHQAEDYMIQSTIFKMESFNDILEMETANEGSR